MIYVPSSHLSLCVIAIRPVGLCACLCDGLWVVIETADCRTAYWRTQTIFRGNAKFHEFPIPLLISSVPTWVMHVVLCTIWPPHCWWPFANCMRLVACCNVLIMNLGKTSDCQKRQKYINKSFYLCVNQEWQTQVCETNWKVEEEEMVLGGVCLCVWERERNQPQVLHTFQCLSYTVSMSTPWCPPACSPARLFAGITWLHSGPARGCEHEAEFKNKLLLPNYKRHTSLLCRHLVK